MAIMQAAASGIGALGIGVGKLGFGIGKGIWKSGTGGKGFLIGSAAGGIYGAASADPRLYESRLERGLWGMGIGALGGAIGGAAIGAGIRGAAPYAERAMGAIKNLGATAAAETIPVSAFEAGLLAKGAARGAKMAAKQTRRADRIMSKAGPATRRAGVLKSATGGGWTGNKWNPIRIPRSTGMRGALGSAVNRAKNYKFNWLAKHRTSLRRLNPRSALIRQNARRMLPRVKQALTEQRGMPLPVGLRPESVSRSPVVGINRQYGPSYIPRSVQNEIATAQGRTAGNSFARREVGYNEIEQALGSRGLTGALTPRAGSAVQNRGAMANVGWNRSGGRQISEAEAAAFAENMPVMGRAGNWVNMLG